jgi:Tol biopolymer transport system component
VEAELSPQGLKVSWVNGSTGSRRVILTTRAARGPQGMGLSPDGRRLALPSGDALQLVDLEASTLREQAKLPGCAFHDAAFSGERIIATAECDAGRTSRLYSVAEDGSATLLTESRTRWMSDPVPSPDGANLLLGIQEHATSAWEVDL